MVFGERLKILRAKMGITREELAKSLSLSYWAISKYENDEREPDYKTLKSLANFFDVSLDYMLGRIEETNPPVYTFSSIKYSIINENSGLLLKEVTEPDQTKNIIAIPVLKEISTNYPFFSSNNIIKYAYVPEEDVQGGECFYLLVTNNAMTGSRIYPGDFVYIRKQSDINNGEIALVTTKKETTLQRIYKTDSKLILQPDNPNYKPEVYSENDITIIGKVLHVKFEI